MTIQEIPACAGMTKKGGEMIEVDSNHCQIVEKSLAGERAVDEQTFASLTILSERLQHLKKLDKSFSSVTFSPDVRELKAKKSAVAVG